MSRLRTGRLRRFASMMSLAPQVGASLVGGEGTRRVVAERMLHTLGELKGGSMKLGQILAQVAEVLPEDVQARMAELFDNAPSVDFADIVAVLDADLPDRSMLAELDPEPMAGASLGQVHRGLLVDGTEVAVKVQYPGVAEALKADVANLEQLAGIGTGGGLVLDIHTQLAAVCDALEAELDYARERRAMVQVGKLLSGRPGLVVPDVVPALCSPRVLTTTLLRGPTLHHVEAIDPAQRPWLGQLLVEAVLAPLFLGHVLNADAHPGNFVVLEGGRGLGLLDFGALRTVEPHTAEGMAALVVALIDGEPDIGPALRTLGFAIDLDHRRVRRTVDFTRDTLAPLVRGAYDYGDDHTMAALSTYKTRHPLDATHFVPPPDVIHVFRALTGLLHGLRVLGCEVDLSATLRSLTK